MDIFNHKEITNIKVVATQVVTLTYDNGEELTVSNTVWSVHQDRPVYPNTEATSGMLHLFQNGAGAGFGFFGYWVSSETPITLNGIEVSTIDEVSDYFAINMSKSKTDL